MDEIANSSYLDFTSYGTIRNPPGTTVETAYGITSPHVAPNSDTLVVGLMVNRASDPNALLHEDWGTRQQALASLESSGSLWSTYGGSASDYATVLNYLTTNGYSVVGDAAGSDGYVTSEESRTIWVNMTADQFSSLFGTTLMLGNFSGSDLYYWNGNLSLPSAISGSVAALWPDITNSPAVEPLVSSGVTLDLGAQSPGNDASGATTANLYPNQIAELYNFPLEGSAYATGTVALNETGIGSALGSSVTSSFQQLLDEYRARVGVTSSGSYYVQGEVNQSYFEDGGDERSLDVGVITSIVPNSSIGLYVGSGYSVFTSYQAAIWDIANNPAVLSSSWSEDMSMNPASPFYAAYAQMFIDGALRGVSVFTDSFDGGSGNETATGAAGLFLSNMSSYNMVVGGTSLSSNTAAGNDTTLADIVSLATAGDLDTIWGLVRGGLRQWGATATAQSSFIETVWNQYFVTQAAGGTLHMPESYFDNYASGGGVDTTQPTPSYQTDFGLTPTSANPGGGTGRGVPDVSALSQGNTYYLLPDANMQGAYSNGGTSAATPFWATLATQINFIFHDQGLPNLGYSNDLYYTAAAIAPASFNDITLGNNVSSYIMGGAYHADSQTYTPTGIGYQAGEGYDLVTGLGTPNGTLLARALSTIAHSQMYFSLTPVLTESAGTWSAGTGESLLFQSSVGAGETWSVSLDGDMHSFSGMAVQNYAWTAALAQQSLQADFSSALVTMFDGFAQGAVHQTTVSSGTQIGIAIGGSAAASYQAAITADYGFTQFLGMGGQVEVARAVAYATTAGAANDQDVVVRLRQNGVNDSAVMFYKVDDFGGTIGGLSPGQAGYAEAAAARAYVTQHGQTLIHGAGYGAYSQTEIIGVDAGDHIAMKLTSGGHTYWAFSSANEVANGEHVAHLWSYGLNTWGWEDLYGGGDRDYNDLIVQLDFTSAAGAGLLV